MSREVRGVGDSLQRCLLIVLLGRHVMMMHVVFVDMNFRDKRRDHDCDVVLEIIRVDVSLVS